MTPEQMQRETRSSIELTRNARGDYQWVVKVYFERDGEGEPGDSLALLHGIDGLLRKDYLPEAGNGQ